MKYTNYELVNYNDKLKYISGIDIDFPVKVAYAIMKNKQIVENALKPYNDMYDAIVDKYGKNGTISKDEDPQAFIAATNDINALLKEESEDIELTKVDIDAFGGITIPMKLMNAMGFMIN